MQELQTVLHISTMKKFPMVTALVCSQKGCNPHKIDKVSYHNNYCNDCVYICIIICMDNNNIQLLQEKKLPCTMLVLQAY